MRIEIAFMLALAACGGSTPAPATPTPTTGSEPAPASQPGLTLTELKFYVDDIPKLALHADGKVEQNARASKKDKDNWISIATVSTNGKIAHDGEPIGELHADGTFVTADGKPMPFKLDGEALVVGDKRITVDDKGVVQGGNPGPEKLRIEGAGDPASRHTALLLLAVMVSQR